MKDELIREIYQNVVCDRTEDETSIWLKQEILSLLEKRKERLENITYEEILDLLFSAAGAGEEAGFIRGFRYAVRLMKEV